MAHMPTTCRRWRWILKSHQKPWNIPDRWYPIGSMYAIYGNIYHWYTPLMLAYIPAPWILWVPKFLPLWWKTPNGAAERINVTIQNRCRSGLMLGADVGWL
jgi:hypothetical protein